MKNMIGLFGKMLLLLNTLTTNTLTILVVKHSTQMSGHASANKQNSTMVQPSTQIRNSVSFQAP